MGVEQAELVAIIFCLTSLIFSWRHTLLGNTSECLVWNWAVEALEGNNPSSWNSSITNCRRLSSVFRSDEDFPS